MSELTCFKTYDIRGEIGVNIDEDIAYRIGRSVAQNFNAKSVVIGFDARETSPAFAQATARGVADAGADVLGIGMAGTEEMYWAVTEFGACAGIEVTASHNPINYNGIKIVKSRSRPLDDAVDFQAIKRLAETEAWTPPKSRGAILDRADDARSAYVNCALSFVDQSALHPLKIVVNSGSGAAGPTFDAIAKKLADQNVPLKFVRVHHEPDNKFPHGIPNPLLPQNHAATAEVVREVGANFGVAFDGDFDRCFFFDEFGAFVPGEYVVGLLASIFLEKEAGAKVVHDPRVIWNTQDIITLRGGVAVQSKTGHAFIKQTMRAHRAIYGGEMSAHHYFRDFAYCDSGMIPWLLVAELMSTRIKTLSSLVSERIQAFPCSGEINYRVTDCELAINAVRSHYEAQALSIDVIDGLSMEFDDWRVNIRASNTEPVLRLNVESKANKALVDEQVLRINNLLAPFKQ